MIVRSLRPADLDALERFLGLPAPPPAFKNACIACHEDDVIRQQRLTRAQWDAEINKMIGWGAKVGDQDRTALLDYLAGSYGPRPR
jgi:hypothetical protein